ncbi:MAG: site-specific DNA-methyltransferase [Melioribacteraceae bacterium]|nr:site-specific DNA-methyltransferase [Melioribacteraceae bacterium]
MRETISIKSRNKTIRLNKDEQKSFSVRLISLTQKSSLKQITNKTIHQDIFEAADFLPKKFVDLLIIDPPYNLTKSFNTNTFKRKNINEYSEWIDKLINKMLPTLKPNATVYFCSDWYSSTSAHLVLSKYFKVRNRITWERDKGRGSKLNWKNNSEDIWFCTASDDYTFNLDEVKLKRKVIAPYKHNGKPKDWYEQDGGYRLTHPSNIWNDISIPFWSMPENTEHPTQKPEKLIAKLILASSNEGDFVFDPFLGSGTSSVVAKKLNRKYCGVEIDQKFAAITEKRLHAVKNNSKIQGYHDGVFYERNSYSLLNKS